MKPNLQALCPGIAQTVDMLVEQSRGQVFVSLGRRAQQSQGLRSRDQGLRGRRAWAGGCVG